MTPQERRKPGGAEGEPQQARGGGRGYPGGGRQPPAEDAPADDRHDEEDGPGQRCPLGRMLGGMGGGGGMPQMDPAALERLARGGALPGGLGMPGGLPGLERSRCAQAPRPRRRPSGFARPAEEEMIDSDNHTKISNQGTTFMSLKLRLARAGAKKRPFDRVVVADFRLPPRRPLHRDRRHLQSDPAEDRREAGGAQHRAHPALAEGRRPANRPGAALPRRGRPRQAAPRNNPQKALPGKKAQERAEAAAAKAAAPAEGATAETAAERVRRRSHGGF